ncbi:MAG: hypothetical protein D3907_14125, partial [Candidatus Electrothrix sp. AUS3]|nr:hypothetical protein [Candidatus Electrothrix gigas]
MTELPDNGLNISRPVSVWNRKIKAEPRKLLLGIGKILVEGVMLDLSDAASATLDTLDAAGLSKKPEELAWRLISRALFTALFDLVKEYHDLFRSRPNEAELDKISALFEEQMGRAEVTINPKFFDRPGALPLLKELHTPLIDWLQGLGAAKADAAQIACRLADYFVFALHKTWRKAPQDYAELKNYFESPFTQSKQEVIDWELYKQHLQRQFRDRLFAEAFGV